MSAIA